MWYYRRMNQFTAKKLGEVLAFCQVGHETFEKGRVALEQGLGAEVVEKALAELEQQAMDIEAAAKEAGVEEITLTKAQGTGGKLRGMRDMYVGDEWDNPAELLEWSGFFEGAAVVHWALVVGAAEALNDTHLQDLAATGKTLHHTLLHTVTERITKLGNQKALS